MPSPSLEPQVVRLHGHAMSYVRAGEGPAVVFLHGVLGHHGTWATLLAELAGHATVVAPDLFGHGESDKPAGDYSLGAHAAALRDLLDALELGQVTVVGHSLGGGVALQFAYLFPERLRRLVLVSSGGLGREVHPLLRAGTLPGAEWALPVLASPWVRRRGDALGRALSRLGLRGGPDVLEAWRGFVSLGDAEARRAFLWTIRGVVDLGGQRVDARDRLPLVAGLPTLLVWGDRDRMIPVEHAYAVRDALPAARLEVFEGAGHFPHLDQPVRFTRLLRDFLSAPEPAGERPG